MHVSENVPYMTIELFWIEMDIKENYRDKYSYGQKFHLASINKHETIASM